MLAVDGGIGPPEGHERGNGESRTEAWLNLVRGPV